MQRWTLSLLVANLLALFVISFIQDILGAYYLRLVNEQRLVLATIISFIHSMLAWAIWLWFMYQFQNPENLSGLQAFIASLGSAIGTFYGLRKPGEKTKI